MDRIPDQTAEVDLRLRMPPYLHGLVMRYGCDNGVGNTTERYRVCLVHFFRVIKWLPGVSVIGAAIRGTARLDTEDNALRIEQMFEMNLTAEEADEVAVRVGRQFLKRCGWENPYKEKDTAERQSA